MSRLVLAPRPYSMVSFPERGLGLAKLPKQTKRRPTVPRPILSARMVYKEISESKITKNIQRREKMLLQNSPENGKVKKRKLKKNNLPKYNKEFLTEISYENKKDETSIPKVSKQNQSAEVMEYSDCEPPNAAEQEKNSPNGINKNGEKLQILAKSKKAKSRKRNKAMKKIKTLNMKKKSALGESEKTGLNTFKWMISPILKNDFFNSYWEKETLLIKSEGDNKFKYILSTSDIDMILRKNYVTYTKNIDVTSYRNGKRETHNPEGRALPSTVWDFYNSGCSVRMLNPQTFHRPIWRLLDSLQDFFHSFCGANVYLTPPGTQGFAPHWDDIEAFILQLEGKKRWRVYRPRVAVETLPRESSGNFGPSDPLGEPVLDAIVEPGDVLYFPRGFIHQGEALDDVHSLHMTVSTFQKNSYVDFLEKLLPAALAKASEECVEFRRGLPLSCFNNMGIAFCDVSKFSKTKFIKKVKNLVGIMMEDAPFDAAIDQMAKGFIHDSLPPLLTDKELKRTVFEGGERWSFRSGCVVNKVELAPDTSIRLLRKRCVRIVVEENAVRLYYTLENSREYHAEDLKYLELAPEIALGVEYLIKMYPKYSTIENLPLENLEDKMTLAQALWEKGIVSTEEILDSFEE